MAQNNFFSINKLKLIKRKIPFGIPILWITLISAIFLTIMLFSTVKNHSYENTENHFDAIVNHSFESLSNRIIAYELALKGGAGLFDASDEVTRKEWKRYINSITISDYYPGIQGLGFSKYIRKSEINNFTEKIRNQGFPTFHIWPEYPREEYSSIIYLEPFNLRNQRAFGYDMFSEPVRHKAMAMARDNGKIAITTKVILKQETDIDVQPGFLMYMPIYLNSPKTVAERKKDLVGWIYSPFRMYDLMNEVSKNYKGIIKLRIFDQGEKDSSNLFYNSDLKNEHANIKPVFKKELILKINNQQWLLVFESLPEFESKIDNTTANVFLFVGLIISVLLFLVIILVSNSRAANLKLSRLLQSTGEGIFGVDNSGNCTFINEKASLLLQYSPEECLGKNMHNLIHHTKADGSIYLNSECPIVRSITASESVSINDDVFWRKDFTSFPVDYSSNPILRNDINEGAVITFNDITERKRIILEIEKSLEEKTILLKEVHHRVKNNLQIISSLLNLQSFQINDLKVKSIFEESQNRILSMALIHEKLYQTNDMAHIIFSDYIRELTNNLLRSFQYSMGNISFVMDLEDINLNIDSSITLGLIINEIISNCFKHAFPNNSDGKININLKEEFPSKTIVLKIKDNGIGLPEEFDYKNSTSLGFRLIVNLVEQLSGHLEVKVDNGTEFIIRFKLRN